ncbi:MULTISPECIES: MerR family transcriptional regulator [Paenibacillus]|jgi:DNA-binding transcriptional MerR regulator|uniref:MerR family transcriptional regulator n=1 Tax=Paenibacillus TaxID=44249 RepID=UPI0004F61304|nr:MULTISPECIES: MerR family transcriptional regulator [unclassified Paenibacillus]AIQ30641.1 MerR family transcriptional regulator [Paenibacillus sp. FSL P4-0081]OMF30213.1 MerR family transcriptional regulator [Paenibacillus sp. FSL H8-0259]
MYSINEVAAICEVTAHTLRFYDKEGLLPFVGRNGAGNRIFSDGDLSLVKVICCLKNTGMPIKDIKKYIELIMEGDSTKETRRSIMIEHRKEVVRQMDELKKNLNIIDLKVALYETNNMDLLREL